MVTFLVTKNPDLRIYILGDTNGIDEICRQISSIVGVSQCDKSSKGLLVEKIKLVKWEEIHSQLVAILVGEKIPAPRIPARIGIEFAFNPLVFTIHTTWLIVEKGIVLFYPVDEANRFAIQKKIQSLGQRGAMVITETEKQLGNKLSQITIASRYSITIRLRRGTVIINEASDLAGSIARIHKKRPSVIRFLSLK